MCAIIRKEDIQPLSANVDIDCYKIMITTNKGKSFKSLYQKSPIEFNKLLKANEGDIFPSQLRNDVYFVDKGYFHSFCSKIECNERAKHIKKHIDEHYTVEAKKTFGEIYTVKCIIPKDTVYHKGKFNFNYVYVSKNIIYTNEITKI